MALVVLGEDSPSAMGLALPVTLATAEVTVIWAEALALVKSVVSVGVKTTARL